MDIKELIKKGRVQGYVSYLDFRDSLPCDLTDEEQIEDIIQMLNDMDIEVRATKAEVIKLFPKSE